MKNLFLKKFTGKGNSKGYTLAEVLIVVGILIVLMAIAIPAIFIIQRNLRQTELDAKAETIYVAVQNKLSKMKAAGDTSILQVGDENGVYKLAGSLSDASSDDYCYFVSTGYPAADTAAAEVMGADTVDPDLLGYHWVVEYNPSNCTVYAVFYSEQKVDCANDYAGGGGFTTYNNYRVKENRLSAGARVGYYGGGAAGSGETLKEINPSIEIVNAETLTALVTCTMPESLKDYSPVFKVEIEDTAGNIYTAYYAYSKASDDYLTAIEAEAGSYTLYNKSTDSNKIEKSGDRTYKLSITLDDLSSSDTRFVNLYGKQPGNAADAADTAKLLCGTDITVTVTAMCPGHKTVSGNHSVSETANSLFDNTTAADETVTAITAEIRYGRHLQNLDASSGVTDKVTAAE